MTNALTARYGSIWVQPGGPNNDSFQLKCRDLGDVNIPGSGIDLLRCFRDDGSGWDIVGEKETAPDKVTFSFDALLFKDIDWLEKIPCPASFYFLQRDCGRADLITNYVRGVVVNKARRSGQKYSGLVKREESAESIHSSDWEAWTAWLLRQLRWQRQVTADTDAVNDISGLLEQRCANDCGTTVNPGDYAATASESAVGPATGLPQFTTNGGITWADAAVAPFAAGKSVMSVQKFYISRDVRRTLVAMTAPAGAQGMVAYSDDAGASWTVVNIGGAAAGHGAVYGRGLFALDMNHIWLAGAAGYIYFSSDGGQTWTVQEAGVIHAGAYNGIKFVDESNGIAWGAAGVVAKTIDGGTSWQACTVPAASTLYAGEISDPNHFWVGGTAVASQTLWYSSDAGVTWTYRTFPGSGVGATRGLSYAPNSEQVLFMVHDTAAPVGSVLRSWDGGRNWELILAAVANSGLNGVLALDESTAYVVGKVNGGTGFISKVTPV